MTFRLALATAVVLVTAGLAASGGKEPHLPLYTQAPGKYQQLRNPLEGDSEAVEFGRRLFERSCAKCHDTEEGARKAPQLEGEQIRSVSAGALFWVIKTGNTSRGMPGFSQLPDKQKWQIVTYVRSRVEEGN